MRDEFIPLLSGRPLDAFTPEEFKKHVRSLYFKQESKKSPAKTRPALSWKRTKSGKLSIQVRRDPQWISEEEMLSISQASGEPLNLLFIYLKKRKIKISTLEAETKIKLAIKDLPF